MRADTAHAARLPSPALPKGGGAIRGIGETFGVEPATGTGRLAIPIPTSAARSGLGPELVLGFDSGFGNGPFGIGWQVALGAITRATEKGLPRYRDEEDSDTFRLSGDDLVPMLDEAGNPAPGGGEGTGYAIRRYRTRIEGGFARIERWTREIDGDVHWRVLSPANVVSVYGRDAASRIADPADPSRIASWLLCESRDDVGNAMVVDYAAEDATGVDVTALHERCRGRADDLGRTVQRYVTSIRYGNRTPLLDGPTRRPLHLSREAIDAAGWMFEVAFDYGHLPAEAPTPTPPGPWRCREDPFSSRRFGFEVRTSRLCSRVLMFHHFPDEAAVGDNCLVASVDLAYEATTAGSLLRSVTRTGHRRSAGGYSGRSLPPVELDYSRAVIDPTVRGLDPESLENLPTGIEGPDVQWLDLYGEGLAGALFEHRGGWHYKPGLGQGRLGPLRQVAPTPVIAHDERPHLLVDLAGNGRVDLLCVSGGAVGFYERDEDGGWTGFVPLEAPNLDLGSEAVRLVDLTGDGWVDLLEDGPEGLAWHARAREGGFGPALPVPPPGDGALGLTLSDGQERLALADMSGDGLADLVRIRNGEIRYWPNLGYGRFGQPVDMSNPPVFDYPDRFDARNLRLADVDGSGVTDVLYIGAGEVRLWMNRSGNAWTQPERLPDLPHLDDRTGVQVADLLGNGTACLVWSSPLPADAGDPVRYVDLMGGSKPYLLTRVANSMGAETRIGYTASTTFALADRSAGRPWITRLPFPVHVVSRLEQIDHISRTRLLQTYSYHHGFYDETEREFRGFAMVEQEDAEAAGAAEDAPGGPDSAGPELQQPPVTTRTWFHTGNYVTADRVLHQLRDEYYQGRHDLPEPALPAGMSVRETRDCVRALKGLPLRSETFSRDGSPQETHPYSVAESAYEVRRLQPADSGHHAVFLPIPAQTLTRHHERDPTDPRVAHNLILEVDAFGTPLAEASVAYGRRVDGPGLPAEVVADQRRLHVTNTERDLTPAIDRGGADPAYRLPATFETRGHEITGLVPAGELLTRQELRDGVAGAAALAYEEEADGVTLQRRLLSRTRTLFLDDALAPLPAGHRGTLGLPYESYRLAFTPGVLNELYEGRVTAAELTAAAYVELDADGSWWIPSGTAVFPAHPHTRFYRPRGARDPFGIETVVTLDGYDLLPTRVAVTQAPWNVVSVINDYRVLGPIESTDPNGNRSAVEVDELGMVVASAVTGKGGEGDTLADPTARMEYDLDEWTGRRRPARCRVLARERHGAADTAWRESYVYSNGSGGVAMTKAQAPPGTAMRREGDGSVTEVDADPRWIGSGRLVLNNKGNAVKRYEPFFSPTHEYDEDEALRGIGVTALVRYDPLGRVLRTEHPDGTLTRSERGPWGAREHDANDTVLESTWYADRGSPDPLVELQPTDDPERRAAWLAARHAGTPARVHLDTLGRPVLAVADHGGGVTSAVRGETDLTGRRTAIFDQEGRRVASAVAAMTGAPIATVSAERGKRWVLADIAGVVVRAWDDAGRSFRTEFDGLRRPLSAYAAEAGGGETLLSHTVYGDRHPDAAARNLLGAVHQVFDPAGSVRVDQIDFKGNATQIQRVLAREHAAITDWSALPAAPDYDALQAAADPALETPDTFGAGASFDALNRPVEVTLHGGTVVRPAYDEAGGLRSLGVRLEGQGPFVELLKAQDHDAHGRRTWARHGNGVEVRCTYDPASFRLTDLAAVAGGQDPATQSLQALRYTYDPVGNVTQVRDQAQQMRFFANAVVRPEARFEYDPVYRLVVATGRERAGGRNDAVRDHGDLDPASLVHVNDEAAVRTYTESYRYDLLGNLLELRHAAGPAGTWTRHYRYAHHEDPSLATNRLVATSRPGDPEVGPYSSTYDHDVYGNITRLRGATAGEFAWDVLDRLQRVALGGGGTAHYQYSGGGRRVRKVIERLGGTRVERIYLGAVEVYRERRADGSISLERRTVHVSDDAGRVAQVDTKLRDEDGGDPANPLGVPLVRYQYGNLLGSATLETDEAGVPISYEEYHPYGTTAYRSGRPSADLSLKRYRFAGKERDTETGLDYAGARYYASWLGRWTSPDPAGFVDGPNLYAYCSGNPVSAADPSGTQTKPLNPAGEVSWVVPKHVFLDPSGTRLSDPAAIANFEAWLKKSHPDRPYTPGSATIDWSTATKERGPVFNAEWLDPNGKPLLPRAGEPGYVAPMRKQERSSYANPANKATRLDENEHSTPRAANKVVEPGYDNKAYRNDATVKSPRGVSLDKTQGDNAASAALKQRAAQGQPINVTEDVDLAANARFQQANENARAAGRDHINNPGSINRGSLEQMGGRSERGKGTALPAGTPIEEPDIGPHVSSGPSGSGAPSLGVRIGTYARGLGGGLARTLIPGFVEAEMIAMYAPALVAQAGITNATIATAAAAAAAAPTTAAVIAVGSAAAGYIVGDIVEEKLTAATGSRAVGVGAGTLAGAAAGAAIGAAIGSLGFGIAAVPGAIIGGAVGALAGFIGAYW